MAMSVNRRIERNLPIVMGQRDPEAMIRVRSTDPIRASGLVPRQQAGHMTASDRACRNAKKPLPAGGHPHMTINHKYGSLRAACYQQPNNPTEETHMVTLGTGDYTYEPVP